MSTVDDKFAVPEGRGIITLADENYFPGLEMLYRSVQESLPVPMACFDCGLSPENLDEISARLPMLQVLELPETREITAIKEGFTSNKVKKSGKREWPVWICPFLIGASPFRFTLWLDCDLVVLRDLEEIFRKIEQQPFFTRENFAPHVTANKPALYDWLPIDRQFDIRKPEVNAGVSGWDLLRDRSVLESYKKPILSAIDHEEVREAISWWDQGALIWAIQNHGLEDCVEQDTRWNLCVRHTEAFEKKYPWDGQGLVDMRNDVPQASILHWNGTTVPWRL